MANRVTFWEAAITGIMGWVFGINAMLGANNVGAGVALIASAIAFGIIGICSRKG